MVTDILSRTFSELTQLIVQTSDTLRFLSHPLGSLGTTCDVYLGLIRKRVVDFLLIVLTELFSLCYSWVATSKKRSKIGDFALTRSVWSQI